MLPYVIYDSTKQGVMHFDGLYQNVLSLKETGNFKRSSYWRIFCDYVGLILFIVSGCFFRVKEQGSISLLLRRLYPVKSL